ncbi:NAD(P)/FAD-dependent oxidoreductase [Streptomyces arenae]|uniref:NAD(P)/FAD-dependent oxidoreductase n=1 Tax=Streptomyces arenae TaxID=29301 RepID=UPI00265A8DC5|nr:NAD(P)/FAD-dependent oxidoreductase [Streptomyces arenae]MCG7207438.1 FAD-dependent oxidoreductase [Streptomyces arenae]
MMDLPELTETHHDIAVVGAGPAGLTAAVTAAELGQRVVLIDAGNQPGGQYWRHPDERFPVGDESAGHHDWRLFESLRKRLGQQVQEGLVSYLSSQQVWHVENTPGTAEPEAFRFHLTGTTAAASAGIPSVVATRVVLAPGGYDRQLPVPGWDLPGVMAAGGVQALLKGHRTVAGKRVVVAGTGPFLLPVAKQLAEHGAHVVAICEANDLRGWLRRIPAAMSAPAKAIEAGQYGTALARHRIPYRLRTAVTRVHANETGDQVDGVTLSRLNREGHIERRLERIQVDLVAMGWGFTPSMELVDCVGADTRQDVDGSLVTVVDDYQRSSVAGVLVAGEATGVGGAALAVAEGELAAITASADSGAKIDERRRRSLRRRIRRLRAFAEAMHLAHPLPQGWQKWVDEETLICRCEEVSYSALRHAVDHLGAEDLRTAKLLARPGMGWCQGHVCGFATACLVAKDGHPTAQDLRAFARQTPSVPVPLGQLADLHQPSPGED